MAKYTITYSCGHEGKEELYGATAERTRRIAYLKTRVCPACYSAQQAAKVGGKWVEMLYREYKLNHDGSPHKDYNPKTKTIMVIVTVSRPDLPCPKCGTYCCGDCEAR